MKEVWKVIKNYPNYLISNLGRVKSIGRVINIQGNYVYKEEGILKLFTNTKGYYIVKLVNEEGVKTFTVHKLVSSYFIGERPKGLVVDHKDNNPLNNKVDNLQYITQRQNIKKDKDKNNFGVSLYDGKYHVRIYFNKVNHYLGGFYKEEDAYDEYNRALHEIQNYNKLTILTPAFMNKTSRFKGVYFEKSRNKWCSSLSKDGKQKRIGRFNSEQEALEALINYKKVA